MPVRLFLFILKREEEEVAAVVAAVVATVLPWHPTHAGTLPELSVLWPGGWAGLLLAICRAWALHLLIRELIGLKCAC